MVGGLKHELAPHNVSVHVVEPGGFRTKFGQNVQWAQHDVGAYRTWTDGYRALNRRLSEVKVKRLHRLLLELWNWPAVSV